MSHRTFQLRSDKGIYESWPGILGKVNGGAHRWGWTIARLPHDRDNTSINGTRSVAYLPSLRPIVTQRHHGLISTSMASGCSMCIHLHRVLGRDLSSPGLILGRSVFYLPLIRLRGRQKNK
jgi:hypothetical protein